MELRALQFHSYNHHREDGERQQANVNVGFHWVQPVIRIAY